MEFISQPQSDHYFVAVWWCIWSQLYMWNSNANNDMQMIFITSWPISMNKWLRHQMETFSALLAIFAGNAPVPVNKGQWRGALMFLQFTRNLYFDWTSVILFRSRSLHGILAGTSQQKPYNYLLIWHDSVFMFYIFHKKTQTVNILYDVNIHH